MTPEAQPPVVSPAPATVGPAEIDGAGAFSKTTSLIITAILCIIAAAAITTVFLLAPDADEAAKNNEPPKEYQFPEFAKQTNGKYFCNLLTPRMDPAIVEIDDSRLLTGNNEELAEATITSVNSEEAEVGDIGAYAQLFPQATGKVTNFTIKAMPNSDSSTESEFQIMSFHPRRAADRRAMIFGASVQGWGTISYACQTEAYIDERTLATFNEWYWGE